LGDFTPPAARFLHVHIYLVEPLPTSAGYAYCLTAVDRFIHWPEVVPILDITADAMACALLTGWISLVGCLQTIIDQGRQPNLKSFHSLAKLCGIQLSQTTAHHPAANGLMEHFHRTLKAAIMCHADQHWTQAFSLVYLGICMTFK
jgi:cleavage and polyadenylation specificity factor subunit 1